MRRVFKGARGGEVLKNAVLSPLPFGSVVMEDGYLKNALEKEISYLLSLDDGRFLAGFYENAGIRTPYVRYGGWESDLIAGHAVGHYLSALAQGCSNRGVGEEQRGKLYLKLKRMVDGLAECQSCSKGGKGFLWAAPPASAGGGHKAFVTPFL